MKKQIVIICFTLLSFLSCEIAVPVLTAGNSGLVSITDKSTDTVTLNWTLATGSTTSNDTLEYIAFYSTEEVDETVSSVLSNATSFSQYSTDITSIKITGLTHTTLYYFYVIVKDGVSGKALYNTVSETTDLDTGKVPELLPKEIPEVSELAYYSSAADLTGYEFKTALYNIISVGTIDKGYGGLWDIYKVADDKYGNNTIVWDIYSDIPNPADPDVPDSIQPNEYEQNFVTDKDVGGGGGVENDFYNREHTMPSSWFDKKTPMYSDAFHVLPTDKKVNNARSNNPYGEVSSPTWESVNGSKLGNNSTSGYSGTVFEPIDTYKGDVARIYFYMATRYENVIENWYVNSTNSDAAFDGSSDKVYEDWQLEILKRWNEEDPVSQKEIDRNEAVFAIQKNRNPFVDHPQWVEAIW